MSRLSRLSFSILAASSLFGSGCAIERVQDEPMPRNDRPRYAQREPMASQDEDPPTWVARLNYIQGPVSFRPGEVDDWVQATLNFPLRAGDHLWVDDEGRAELHGGATALRLGPRTALAFLNFSDQLVQLRLTDGSLELRVRHLDGQRFEIATPQGAVTISRPGTYRIDVNGDGDRTAITTRSGGAEVSSNGSSLDVDAGHSLALQGGDYPTYDLTEAFPRNGFEAWCGQRDQREEGSASVRYVGREMIGYEDLDENGTWTDVPEYGPVWRPRVAVGWAPYHQGHWAWVGPWGWTWVDDAPWGFAPFHYGRWAYLNGGWGWIPGRVAARPVYAPALVVFVGGSGFSASMSFGGGGGVAWFPLGPREVYRPAYRVSNTYVQNVNITHVTNVNVINVTNVNVTNITYVNRTVAGAVTAVPHSAFIGSRSVAAAALPVSPGALRQAQVTGSTALVAPSRASVLARSGPGAVVHPPPQIMNRGVVSRTPPPPPPVSFAARQQAQAANPGKPLDRATLDQLRQNEPMAAPPVRSATVATTALRPARQGLPAPKPMAERSQPQPVPRTPVPNPSPAPRPEPSTPRPSPDRPVRVEPVESRPARPAERTVERPVDRPVDRVEPPVKRPVDRPVESPAKRPVERPVDHPAPQPPPPKSPAREEKPSPREGKRAEPAEPKREKPKKEEDRPRNKDEKPVKD